MCYADSSDQCLKAWMVSKAAFHQPPWYDTTLGITMLAGRFLMIIPMLAIAGNLAGKKYVPPSLV